MDIVNLKTGSHFRDLTKNEICTNVCTSQCRNMTRGGFLRGILASGIAPSLTLGAVGLAGSANATVARGMMRNKGAQLSCVFDAEEPKPYLREVKYLSKSGSRAAGPFINTGFIPSKLSKVSVEFLWKGVTNSSVFGYNSFPNYPLRGFMLTIYNNRYYFSNGQIGGFDMNCAWIDSPFNQFVEVSLGNGFLYSNGKLLDSRASAWNESFGEICVFKRSVPASPSEESGFDGYIKSCLITDNDIRIRDYITVVADRGYGEEGAFFDKANPNGGYYSNGLYYNDGTGKFGWEEFDGTIVNPT